MGLGFRFHGSLEGPAKKGDGGQGRNQARGGRRGRLGIGKARCGNSGEGGEEAGQGQER